MQLQPLSPNILVKVPKKTEVEMREMKNGIYLHPNFVWMTRNTQCGEIVALSNKSKKEIPEAKVGDILLFHHFIQRSNSLRGDNNKFLAAEDDDYKFYNVNAIEWNGNNNNTYGVWNGTEIIPHKDYVFLEKPIEDTEAWHQSNEKIYEKMEAIKLDVQRLAKNKMTDELMQVMKSKEKEMQQMTMSMQKKEYLQYKIAYANPSLGIPNGTYIYAINIACQCVIEFGEKEYIIAESKYMAAV